MGKRVNNNFEIVRIYTDEPINEQRLINVMIRLLSQNTDDNISDMEVTDGDTEKENLSPVQ